MFKHLSLALGLSLALNADAQQPVKCATDEYHQEAIKQHPELVKIEQEANEHALKSAPSLNKASQIRYIPVVFHVIHKNGFENISQAQIMDQIRILNEDFRKKSGTRGGSSTNPLAADMEFEFRLAQYDPNGNKHDGINRIYSSLTDEANNSVKALSYWDSEKYLNVWVVNTIAAIGVSGGTVLGYAQFPWDRASKPTTDGIVIRADQVGVVGIGDDDQAGRTLTHEIGHWLGLYHTFQGGCSGSGDGVGDTPPVASASSGCNKGRNSCNNDSPNLPDQIENYMDYSDGTCMELFTLGQKTRVQSIVQQYRSFLYTNVVTYAGIDQAGNYVPVTPSSFVAPISFTFETGDPAATSGFRYNNFNNNSNNTTSNTNGWAHNGSTGFTSSGSVSMLNFNNPTPALNSRDGFQTPEINLANLNSPFLEFNYAYAQKSSVNFDSLCVYVSGNFGMNEEQVFGETGSKLATTGIQTNSFVPNNNEWRKVSINLWKFHLMNNVRVRFEFFNRRGNNIYIDNISLLNGSTGVNDQLKKQMNFNMAPNPVSTGALVSFELKQSQYVKISITDQLGKEVKNIHNGTIDAGKSELYIERSGIQSGLYYIQFEAGDQRFTHKLLIN